MANEKRLYRNFIGGTLTSELQSGQTTMASTALAALPVIDTTNHVLLTINPNAAGGLMPEVVKVTSHVSEGVDATVIRAQEGTTQQTHPVGTKWHLGLLESDVNSFGLIGFTAYEPGSAQNKTITATTLTTIDSTNLSVGFTAPGSGKVLVRLNGLIGADIATSNTAWGLLDGVTQRGKVQRVLSSGATDTDQIVRATADIYVSGLTAATTYTFNWAGLVATGATATLYIDATSATTSGGAYMEVWSVNK